MAKSKKVYSVVSTDITNDEPVDTMVVGTYIKREDAVTACVDYIVERLVLRPDIRYAFLHDENHNALKMVSKWSNVSPRRLKRMFAFNMNDGWEMPESVEISVRWFVREVAEGGVYNMSTDIESDIGCESFVFDIQENTLK
jgi:hypothetical protein